jgi:hypothetical protein
MSPRKSPTKTTNAPVTEMPASGQSKQTKQAKTHQDVVAEEFLQHVTSESAELAESWGQVWDLVPEDVLASRPIWGMLASFLAEHYIIKKGCINQGQHYDLDPAHGVWGGLIDSARKRLSASGSTKTKVRAPAPLVL